jgi:hypothetical protein
MWAEIATRCAVCHERRTVREFGLGAVAATPAHPASRTRTAIQRRRIVRLVALKCSTETRD